LVFGADNLLYYSCGDMGANQFGNRCQEVRSQKLPTAAQLAVADYSLYAGKILRLDPTGSIPPSNPVLAGVRSHVYSLGHRNAQGLVAQQNPSNGLSYPVPTSGGRMFSSEHGPRTDDEINVIESGGNYGWPYIAGYLDNLNYQYVAWATSASCGSTPYSENAIPAGAMIRQESDTTLANFRPPLSTLYTVCSPLPLSVCDAGGTNWMRYPTIAPSAIDFYAVQGGTGIPGWYPSLLVPTLRRGVLFRYKLNGSMDGFDTDSIPYFRTSNRYRDLAISPDGRRIFIITDSTGTTSGPSGTGTSSLANPGAILEFTYAGPALSLGKQPETAGRTRNHSIRLFPNPAADWLQVEVGDAAFTRFTGYTLTDLGGRIVAQGKSAQKNFRIDLRSIPTGMYICKLTNGLGLETASEKIIIHR
jgi:PQQ-dependent dehydrogenase (s-GDH family)